MTMKAIGIDLGTTSISGILFDVDTKEIVKSITRQNSGFLDSKYAWEKIQDPEENVLTANKILDELICDDVACIGVTGQMHGIVYYDANGRSVSPLFTWQDARGDLPYKETTYAKYLNSHSGYGHVTDFYNCINSLVPTNAIGYCTIADYFVMKICHIKSPIIHISNAASFGRKSEINDFSFVTTKNFKIAGNYRSIPVSVAIGDNQASVLSCCDAKSALVNIGTGSQVSIISSSAKTDSSLEVRPYFEDKNIIVGSSLCGGRSYSLLKDFFASLLRTKLSISDDEVYGIMNSFVNADDTPSVCADTRFAGTRENTEIKGSYTNISTDSFTPKEFVISTLYGMTKELHALYEKMKEKRTTIVCSGNAVRKNSNLLKIIKKVFTCEVKIPNFLEEAAFGACLFALISIKKYSSVEEAQNDLVLLTSIE